MHPFEIKDPSSLSFFPLTSILGIFKNKSQGRVQKKQNKTKTELVIAEVKHSAANTTLKNSVSCFYFSITAKQYSCRVKIRKI